MLRNLRVKTRHTNMEFKIIGLSEMPCSQQLYALFLLLPQSSMTIYHNCYELAFDMMPSD